MGNNTKQNKDQDNQNFQQKKQSTNSKNSKPQNDGVFINNEGLPTRGTTIENANSNGTLSDYDDDKKNTAMEEGLENRIDTEDNNPDDDKVDFEEEEEEEELDLNDIDLDYKYQEEEEEEEEEESKNIKK